MPLPLDQIAAVVLAGGFGTRIRHILPHLPKPMAPVAGRPFIEWVVRFLAHQGVPRVLISTHHLAETIQDHFAGRQIATTHVTCLKEETPLGTAGGFVHAAQSSAQKPSGWLVLNGDSLLLTPIAPLLDALDPKTDAAIFGLPVPDASRYGSLEINSQGNLVRFAEKRPGPATINAGVYFFRRTTLEDFPAQRPLSFETEVFPELIARGKTIRVVSADAPFLDIGTEASLKEAEAFILQHQDQFTIPGANAK